MSALTVTANIAGQDYVIPINLRVIEAVETAFDLAMSEIIPRMFPPRISVIHKLVQAVLSTVTDRATRQPLRLPDTLRGDALSELYGQICDRLIEASSIALLGEEEHARIKAKAEESRAPKAPPPPGESGGPASAPMPASDSASPPPSSET